jgi:hypothetical protein
MNEINKEEQEYYNSMRERKQKRMHELMVIGKTFEEAKQIAEREININNFEVSGFNIIEDTFVSDGQAFSVPLSIQHFSSEDNKPDIDIDIDVQHFSNEDEDRVVQQAMFKKTTIDGKPLDEVIEKAQTKAEHDSYFKKPYLQEAVEQLTIEFEQNLRRQLEHSFYNRTDQFREDVKQETLVKAAKKYPEPFNPFNWTIYQLAKHAMAENYDQGNYINGLYEVAQALQNKLDDVLGILREAQYTREDQVNELINKAISVLVDGHAKP